MNDCTKKIREIIEAKLQDGIRDFKDYVYDELNQGKEVGFRVEDYTIGWYECAFYVTTFDNEGNDVMDITLKFPTPECVAHDDYEPDYEMDLDE